MSDHLNASNSSDGYNPLEHTGEVLTVHSADGDAFRERRQRHTEGDGSDGQDDADFRQSFLPGAMPSQDEPFDGARHYEAEGNQLSPSARSQSGKSEENEELFSPVRTLKFGETEDSASNAGSDVRLGGIGVEDSGFMSQLSRGMDRGDGAYANSHSPSMLSSMRIVEGHVSPPGDLLGARASSGFAFSANSSTKDEDFVPLESDNESLQNGQNLYDSLERGQGEEGEAEDSRPVQDIGFPRGLDALSRSLQMGKLDQQSVESHRYPGSDGSLTEGQAPLNHSHHSDGWADHRQNGEVNFPRGLDALSQSSRSDSQRGSQASNARALSSLPAFLDHCHDLQFSEHHSLPQDSTRVPSAFGRQRSNSTGGAVHDGMPDVMESSDGGLGFSPPSPSRQDTTTPPLTGTSMSPHPRTPPGPGAAGFSPRGCGSGSADVTSPQQLTSQQIGIRPTVHDGDGACPRVATSVSVTIPQMSLDLNNSALGADSQSFPATSTCGAEQLESRQQHRDIPAFSNTGKGSSNGDEKGSNSNSDGQGARDADANANARIVGRAVPKLKGFGNGRDFKQKKGSSNDLDICPRLSRTQQRMDQMQFSQQNAAGHARPATHHTAATGGHPQRHTSQPQISGMQRSASQPIPSSQQQQQRGQPSQQAGAGRGSSASAAHFHKPGGATYTRVAGHQRDRVGVQDHKAARPDPHSQGVEHGAGAREAAGGEGIVRGGAGGRGGGETVKPSVSQDTVVLSRHVPGTSAAAAGRERFARPPSPRGPPSPHSSFGEFSPPRERGPVPGSRAEAAGSYLAGGGNQGQRTAGSSVRVLPSHLDQEEVLQSFSGIDSDLQGMENVRSHLQQMLSLSHTSPRGSKRDLDVNGSVSDLLLDGHAHHSPRGALSGVEDVLLNRSAPMSMDEDVSELFESFPNFSSKLFSHRPEPPRHDASVQGEYQYLQRCLEKERLRRKHCEEQIQHLNAKLLEVQEQLAVAVSTDKRKDIMIEQLDKQLAKVVEGWKQREADKDAYLRKLLNEKQLFQERFEKQEKTIGEFEREMADVVQQLREERDKSAQAISNAKMQLAEKSREKSRAEELLAAERERASLIQQEWEQLKEARDLAERRADQIQERLHMEQDDWYRREQELIQQIDTFKDSNLKALHLEKAKVEEARKKKEDLEERLEEAQTTIRKLELDMDTLARQKESMKVEMAIQEAKHESSLRKLESDMQVQMEKELSEQATKHLKEMEAVREELQERHKTAVNDIHRRHQRDLDKQLQKFRDDAQIREDDYRAQIRELEERLQQYRDENTALKHGKQKLESQRMEVLNKLQFIMQSQWNETVSLLANSPQKKDQTQNSLHASAGLLHNSSAVSQLMSGAGPSGSNHLNFSFLSQSETAEASISQNDLPAPPPPPSSQPPAPFSSSGGVSSAPSQSSHFAVSEASLQQQQLHPGNTAAPSTASVSPSAGSNLATASAPPSRSSSSTQQQQQQQQQLRQQGPQDEQSRLHSYLRELKDLQGKYTQGGEGAFLPALPQDANCSNPRALPQPRQSTPPAAHPLGGVGEGQALAVQDVSFSEQLLAFLNSSHTGSGLPLNLHGLLLGQSNASNNQSFMSEASIPPHAQLPSQSSHGHPPSHPPSHPPPGQPPTAIMIRPPLQQSHVGGSGPPRGPPSPRKRGSRGRPAPRPVSEEDNGSDSWEDDDDDSQELVQPFRSYGQSPPVRQGGREQRGPGERASRTASEAGSVDIADLSGVLEESVHKISERVELHENRQTELQRYIRMLLEKAPGSPVEGGADPYAPESDIMETSRELTGEFDLNDTAQAAQLQRELGRLQQLRESQKQSSGTATVSELPERDQARRPAAPRHQVPGVEGMAGVLQPEQLAEISLLLEQCKLQYSSSQGHQPQPPHAAPSSEQAAQLRQLLHTSSSRKNGGPQAAQASPKGSPKRQGQRSRDSSQQRRAAAGTKSSVLARDVPSRPETGADNSRQPRAGVAKKQDRKMAAVKPTPSKARTSKSSSAWK